MREASPFFNSPLKGEGGRDFREGRSPSLTYTPPSLTREGGQGDRLLDNLKFARSRELAWHKFTVTLTYAIIF